MKYHIFNNADRIPLLGLGTWKSTDQVAYETVRKAVEIGYRHFDCAARYENEKPIGTALDESLRNGRINREELWITSKLWNNAHLPERVEPALKQTLLDLRLDYLDLYLIHWPVAFHPEVNFPTSGSDLVGLDKVPIEETWQALEACVRKGLCKHLGVSNFSIKKISGILHGCTVRPEVNQIEAHPLLQQDGLVDFCRSEDILITAYSPLGSSDRPPRLIKPDDPVLLEDDQIRAIAEEINLTPAQLLLAWAVNRNTAVIPKSSNPQRMKDNLDAADIALPDEIMARMKKLDRHFRYVDGSIWTLPGSPYTIQNLWDE